MNFKRYIRQINLSGIGSEGQNTLQNSVVAIIGAGGLGIPAALYLAGAGVGKIKIFDFDSVELSNLHRQIIYTEGDIGQNKANILTRHINRMNSSIECEAYSEKINKDNSMNFLNDCDIVLDCSDNSETRYIINDTCILLNKAFVSASIYKYEGQLGVFNLKGGPTYRCLYQRPNKTMHIASCDEVGVLATLPGILGAMQANETLKCLLNIGDVLSGKILIINVLNYQTSIFELERNELEVSKVLEQGISYDKDLSSSEFDIDYVQLQKLVKEGNCLLIDVRENQEFPIIENEDILSMPMSLEIDSSFLPNDEKKLVCFCQSGIRSQRRSNELRKKGLRAYNLVNGISELELSGLFKFSYELSV